MSRSRSMSSSRSRRKSSNSSNMCCLLEVGGEVEMLDVVSSGRSNSRSRRSSSNSDNIYRQFSLLLKSKYIMCPLKLRY